MRRIFSNGILFFAGVVSVPGTLSSPAQPAVEYKQDPRLAALRHFFRAFACPVERYSEEFLRAADAHKLDWRLLPSISIAESGGGRSARNNNLFGWDSGRAAFTSVTQAIHHVAYRLATSELYKGKDLTRKLRTYNPDADYPRRIQSLMRQLRSAQKPTQLHSDKAVRLPAS